jgi:hypothetical protein
MKTTALASGLGLGLAVCLHSGTANAIPRTFVSGTGGGATCSRAAPCADFQAAHNATDPGGEVSCLDAGNFGGTSVITISKSITIDCAGAHATVFAAGTQGFLINTAGVTVRLRNLTIDGGGGANIGIQFSGGAALFVENCVITNFANIGPAGIFFAPEAGTSRLSVSDTVITNINGSLSGVGIELAPISSATAQAAINGVRLENNKFGIGINPSSGQTSVRAVIARTVIANNISVGILLDGTNSSARSVVEIDDSVVAGNGANGITVNNAGMVIERTAVQGNGGNGILAGPGALIHLGNSSVAANALAGLAYNGGQILSYQNNATKGNGTDNAPSGVLTLN